MFTRERFGSFAVLGNVSMGLLAWREAEVLMWLLALYRGREPSDMTGAFICLLSVFLTVPARVDDYPFGALNTEELWRMALQLRCMSLARRLAMPHSLFVLLCNCFPAYLAPLKYVLSPILLALPFLCWWYLSLFGTMVVRHHHHHHNNNQRVHEWHVDTVQMRCSIAAA